MNNLNRKTARNAWLVIAAFLIVSSYTCYRYAAATRADIDQANLDLEAVHRELENAQRLSAALEQLDSHTINEATATRLEILRHLKLEQTDYNVDITSRIEKQIGNSTLYVRNITITVSLPYQALMTLMDRFHNEGRLIISSVTLEQDDVNPINVKMTLQGTLYGMQKKVQTP